MIGPGIVGLLGVIALVYARWTYVVVQRDRRRAAELFPVVPPAETPLVKPLHATRLEALRWITAQPIIRGGASCPQGRESRPDLLRQSGGWALPARRQD